MSEEETQSYLYDNVEENVIDAEVISEFEGVCERCLGSGYLMKERDGVLGVVFTSTMNDSEGKPVRRLVRCECKVQVDY